MREKWNKWDLFLPRKLVGWEVRWMTWSRKTHENGYLIEKYQSHPITISCNLLIKKIRNLKSCVDLEIVNKIGDSSKTSIDGKDDVIVL